MSFIHTLSLRIAAIFNGTLPPRSQHGQATSEYGVVLLIAIALASAVLMLFVGGEFDDMLKGLLNTVLKAATGMVKAG